MPVNMKHAKSLQLWRTPRPGSGSTAACSPRLSGWMYTRLYIMHNYSFLCIFMYYQIIIQIISYSPLRVKVAKFTRQSRRKVAGIFPRKSNHFPKVATESRKILLKSRNRKSQDFTQKSLVKVARFYSKVASESRKSRIGFSLKVARKSLGFTRYSRKVVSTIG